MPNIESSYTCLLFLSAGHVSENESLFDYSIGDTSYAAINHGYLNHTPLFTDEVIGNASQEVLDMCGGNVACIYDSTVTGSLSVGQATLNTSQANQITIQILGQLK